MSNEYGGGLLPDIVEQASSPLFHYTSPSGLLGLAQNHEMWATEATGMNDLAEVRQGWSFIKKWLKGQGEDEVLQLMRRACKEGSPVNHINGIYMCCASTRGDDSNQWRLYAQGGRGYAVEIDPSTPLAVIASARERPGPTPRVAGKRYVDFSSTTHVTPWLRVLYRSKDKKAALGRLAHNARQELKVLNQTHYDDRSDYEADRQMFQDSVLSDVARIARLMKSDGFSGEEEFRVVVTPIFDNASLFRATESGIVRYVRLTAAPVQHPAGALVYRSEVEKTMSVPLESVRLGPLIHAQNNVDTIKELLRRNRYKDAAVKVSKVPLRS